MEGNYYFTDWIKKHSAKEFKTLSDLILKDAVYPKELKGYMSKDDYGTSYCLAIYQIVAMNYFGLSIKQMKMLLDIVNGPNASVYFDPAKILLLHKDAIPKIEDYIKMDAEEYAK